jgi:hypothetical protein
MRTTRLRSNIFSGFRFFRWLYILLIVRCPPANFGTFYQILCLNVFIFLLRAPVEPMGSGSTNLTTAVVVGGGGGSGVGKGFEDPSEPIYTDPSLFERSRSLRSITFSTAGQNVFKNEAFCHWCVCEWKLMRATCFFRRWIIIIITIINIILLLILQYFLFEIFKSAGKRS